MGERTISYSTCKDALGSIARTRASWFLLLERYAKAKKQSCVGSNIHGQDRVQMLLPAAVPKNHWTLALSHLLHDEHWYSQYVVIS